MNTITSKRQPDFAYAAFLFLAPVIFYWCMWVICNFIFSDSLEGEILMRSIFPRKLLGLPVHLLVFILTSVSLYFSVSAKLKRRTRWYKTPLRIRIGIGLGMFLMFLVFLQALI